MHTGGNDFFAQLEPWIYAVAQPGRIQEADANGNIVVIAGTTTQTCTSSDSRGWWVTEYQWTFSPVGGTDVTFSTSTPVAALSLSGIEYGQISIVAYNYRCDQTSVARTANIVRKLASPTWISYDEVMCNNTTSSFTINSAYATSFYWVATGGFEIWNGSSYVTSLLTTSTSVTVKSRSTNGGGSVSVTAKRVGSNVLDSEPLIKDLWSGIFSNPYVDGSPDVCPNSLYTYSARIPFGDPALYSYAWTYPSGWYFYSQWQKSIPMISLSALVSTISWEF